MARTSSKTKQTNEHIIRGFIYHPKQIARQVESPTLREKWENGSKRYDWETTLAIYRGAFYECYMLGSFLNVKISEGYRSSLLTPEAEAKVYFTLGYYQHNKGYDMLKLARRLEKKPLKKGCYKPILS